MAHPSLYLLGAIAIGVFIGSRLPASIEFLLASSFSLLVLTLSLHFAARLARRNALDALALLSLGALVVSAFAAYGNLKTKYVSQSDLVRFANAEVAVRGVVATQVAQKAGLAQWTLNAERVVCGGDTFQASGKARVRLYGELKTPLRIGDEVWAKGYLKLPPKAMNAGEFDYRTFLDERDIYVVLSARRDSAIQKTGETRLSLYEERLALPLAERVGKAIETHIPSGDAQAFVKGLILGERGDISDEVKLAFQRTGTIHVLVISGLHVGLLVLLLDLIFKRLKTTRAGKWLAFGLTTATLAIYANLTGNSPPVARAVAMALVFELSRVIERKAYPLNTLAFCVVVILAFDPRALFGASLQLTTAAVASILLVYPRLSEPFSFETEIAWLKPFASLAKCVWDSLALTLSASIGTSPLIAYYFGATAFLGILANLPVVLLTSLAVYAAIPMILFDLLSQTLASPYGACVFHFVDWAIAFAQWFSALPLASIEVRPTLLVLTTFYLAVVATLQLDKPKTRAKWAIATLSSLNLAVWLPIFEPKEPAPRIVFNALRGGASIFFNASGETLLIDAGAKRSDWTRIERQLQRFDLNPVALARFSTSDSVARNAPIERKVSRQESFKARGVALARASVEHCKIVSKRATLLCSQHLKSVEETAFFKADVIFLKLLRFRDDEKTRLERWIRFAEPKLIVAELSPFMRRVEKKFFYRFAKNEPRLKTTERDGQIVWR
ncbi:MAG: ComEC family competence protein [Chloroherpetonaceae bacterium]|nr:ComEC family competence protein [Chloroherpetonaceae bacterium]MDW8437318.1 ComEC/Rec2 family competence protein [Chloroherpetonaceae bacterium]